MREHHAHVEKAAGRRGNRLVPQRPGEISVALTEQEIIQRSEFGEKAMVCGWTTAFLGTWSCDVSPMTDRQPAPQILR